METFDEMVKLIAKEAKLEEAKVRVLVEEKQDELSGLVSAEGAAYIVGRELGVNLLPEGKKTLDIKSLRPGMGSVTLTARVLGLSEKREFERKGRKGAVRNITLGDSTGTIRMSLWNEELDLIDKLKIVRGSIVKIKRGMVRADNRNNPELRLGRGSLEPGDQKAALPKAEEIGFQRSSGRGVYERKHIGDLKEGDFAEVRAALVQVFKRKPFYDSCTQCMRKVTEENGQWVCKEHGPGKKGAALMVSGVLDDGSGSIRAVFFRDLAEKVWGKQTADLVKEAEKESDQTVVYASFGGLVKDFIIQGKVGKNSFSGNLEMMVARVEDINPVQETKLLRAKSN
ncbi:MAG: DUF2240 family protein [Nanoarchaeota archaeon]|nr:DUF2240 family protein [Nanoarchaeota archaeon]